MLSGLNSYRVIRAPLGLVELWAHLSKHPSLARQVEVVEVQRQMTGFNFHRLRRAIVPPDFNTTAQSFSKNKTNVYSTFMTHYLPSAREAEKTLIAAVKNMTALKSFQWDREPPLYDSHLDDGIEDDIWTALRSCSTLRSLRVMDASDIEIWDEYDRGSVTKFRPIQESQIFSLSNLESLDYHTYGYNNQMRRVPVNELIEMLSHRCPNLKNLKLKFSVYGNVSYTDDSADLTTVDLNSLFSDVTWPNLEAIELYGVHLSPSVVSRFLAAHPSIRTICVVEATAPSQFVKQDDFDFLEPKSPGELSFPPNTLPNLIDIWAPDYLTLSILASPTSSPRPLSKLLIPLTDESWKYLGGLSSLKDIFVGTTTPEQLTSLAAMLPNIVELGATPARDVQVSEFIRALSHFRRLEVLNHSCFISEVDSPEKIELVLRQLVIQCDRLRCISLHCSDQLGVTCNIDRHEDGRIDWVISALDKRGSFFMG